MIVLILIQCTETGWSPGQSGNSLQGNKCSYRCLKRNLHLFWHDTLPGPIYFVWIWYLSDKASRYDFLNIGLRLMVTTNEVHLTEHRAYYQVQFQILKLSDSVWYCTRTWFHLYWSQSKRGPERVEDVQINVFLYLVLHFSDHTPYILHPKYVM